MLKIKFLEIRDRGATISAMAIDLAQSLDNHAQINNFLRHAGYGWGTTILLIDLATPACENDVYEWKTGARTFPVAHNHIQNNWDKLKTGDLIDVEVILGEKQTPSKPEIGTPFVPAIFKNFEINEETIKPFIMKQVVVYYGANQPFKRYIGQLIGLQTDGFHPERHLIYLKGQEYSEKGFFHIKIKSIQSIEEIPF